MTNIDLLYNKTAAQKFFGKNNFIDKKLHFRIIERGTLLPHKQFYINGEWTWGFGGIVDRRNDYIKSSFVNSGAGDAYTPDEDVQYLPATVIYLGLFVPVWGHSLTDNIRRIWFFKSDLFKHYFQNCPVVYLPWRGTSTLEHQKNFRRLLEILDIDVDQLQPIHHPTRFDNIILPDESFYLQDDERKFTAEYRETIDRLRDFALKNRTPTSAKKFTSSTASRRSGRNVSPNISAARAMRLCRPNA